MNILPAIQSVHTTTLITTFDVYSLCEQLLAMYISLFKRLTSHFVLKFFSTWYAVALEKKNELRKPHTTQYSVE